MCYLSDYVMSPEISDSPSIRGPSVSEGQISAAPHRSRLGWSSLAARSKRPADP